MKITIFFLFALLGWGQIERPQLGLMLDAIGAVRPVYGTAASATLGEPVLTGVLSFGCSAQVCLVKTETAAYAYLPQTGRLVRWNDRQLRAVHLLAEKGISPNIIISEDQVRLVRPDGSEASFDVAGVQQFFAMGKGYVQLVASAGMWMLRLEPGREQVFLLPGIAP